MFFSKLLSDRGADSAQTAAGASKFLSVNSYNTAEAKASARLAIPLFMAFRPVAFESVGWPTRISTEGELLRYVDHNFEAEVPSLFKPNAEFAPIGYRNSFTSDEKEIIGLVRDSVGELTKKALGQSIRPVSNLLVQTGPFRVIEQLAKMDSKRLSVFEVGPGAGYLGALLAQAGHRYASYDVAQSLYLWQSWLLQAIAKSDFTEVVGLDGTDAERLAFKKSRVFHLPWWSYAKFLSGTSIRTDVVYSNSNLSEMTNLALRHVLHISRHMLSDSKIGLFCFFSKGMPSQTPHDRLDEEFKLFGFHKVFDSPFFAYTLKPEQALNIKTIFANGIEPYNPSGRTETFDAKDVVPMRQSDAPLDTQLTQWLHGWVPPFVD